MKISRSLAKTLKKKKFKITFNRAFADVVRHCAAPRAGDTDTWITPDMASAYIRLHKLGHGISTECWHDGILAGGLYGVAIGRVFFGESMFSLAPDASKVALVNLADMLNRRRFRIIDCQVQSRTPAEPGRKVDAAGCIHQYPEALLCIELWKL